MTKRSHINITSLKLKKDIARVFRFGKSKSQDEVTIKTLENKQACIRILIVPVHGFGNAVKRNLLKRRVREIFRELEPFLFNGFDIVIIVRKKQQVSDYSSLKNKIDNLLGLHKIKRINKQ